MDKPYKLKRPKGMDDYILEHAEYNYIYFTKKDDEAYCTACRKKITLPECNEFFTQEDKKHNQMTLCPCCGKKVLMKEARYGRLGLEENGRILWFRKHGQNTYAQLDEYDIDYTNYEPKIYYWPSAQYKFSKKETKFYKNTKDYGWFERKNVILPSARQGMLGWWQKAKYEKTILHMPTLNNFGTDLQYQTMCKDIEKHKLTPYGVIMYLKLFLKYPSIEVLEKSGFEAFVYCKLDGEGFSTVNWRKKKLTEIFGLPMNKVRELREMVKNPKEYPINIIKHYIRNLNWLGRDISIELSEEIANMSSSQIKMIEKYMTIEKADEYVSTQEMTIRDYVDYLDDCDFLGMNLNDKKTLKPGNLRKAHEETSAKREIVLDGELKERFITSENFIAGKYSGFEFKNLFIRIAKNPEELQKEAKELCHCVRTYTESVAKGRTSILFIREKDHPDKPFYTLELNKNREIIQVRGEHNKSMTDEVNEFVEEWKKYIKRVNTKKRKEAAA